MRVCADFIRNLARTIAHLRKGSLERRPPGRRTRAVPDVGLGADARRRGDCPAHAEIRPRPRRLHLASTVVRPSVADLISQRREAQTQIRPLSGFGWPGSCERDHMRSTEKTIAALKGRRQGYTLPRDVLRRSRHLPARPRPRLLYAMAVRRPRLRTAAPRRLPHGAGRRLSDRRGARPGRRNPRLPQHLPASRLAHLLGGERLLRPARLPLSQLELRSRRAAVVRARHGQAVRPEGARPEADRLRERRRLCLDLPCRRRRRISRRSARR